VNIIQLVSDGDHPLVEPLVGGFAAADQQDGGPTRVEGKENAVRLAALLNSKFFHVAMA
jgi:hypothetical protein